MFQRQAVAAAHPLAAEAALGVLRDGGGAVDAAIAAQMVLGLVEPQSSGLGGGAFLLVHDGAQIDAWDGRETAPSAVDERWFLNAAGQPLPFSQALVGGRAVGVPGVLRMLEAAHRVHGRLPWARLFEPAIALATEGAPIGPRLAKLLASDAALPLDPHARRHYYNERGQPLPVGTRLRNPDQAALLTAIAQHGTDAFYRGAVARAIVQTVQHHPVQAGVLTERDLATYQPERRTALCVPWRVWRLCGMPPPSSGLIAVGQLLLLTDTAQPAGLGELDANGLPTAAALHRWAQASRLAFADREAFVADPAFAPPPGPWSALLDQDYLRARAALIGTLAATALAGTPWPGMRPHIAADTSHEVPATSHLSIVDARGQAVAMTTSIEAQFGARVMVNIGHGPGGFLLNNQLTDFNFVPMQDRQPAPNRVQPGKRPRSSMAPLFVLRQSDGRLDATLGAPGGPFIIAYVAKALLGLYAQGLTPQQAVNLPNAGVVSADAAAALVLERGAWPRAVQQDLATRGHTVREADLPSGIHLLVRRPDGGWTGAADPRREGVVVGD